MKILSDNMPEQQKVHIIRSLSTIYSSKYFLKSDFVTGGTSVSFFTTTVKLFIDFCPLYAKHCQSYKIANI